MAKFTIDVKKAEEFTINELAIIKDEIETLIKRKHPSAEIASACKDLDAKIAEQDKTGYTPNVSTPVIDDEVATTAAPSAPVDNTSTTASTVATTTEPPTEETPSAN